MIEQKLLRTQAGIPAWKSEITRAFTTPEALIEFLRIPTSELPLTAEQPCSFPMMVPRSFAQRMRKSDPNDPLFLQVYPRLEELATVEAFAADPVGDIPALAAPGLLQKYHGRALMLASSACPVQCRFCFRKSLSIAHETSGPNQETWDYIAQHSDIHELILSGGDPLMLDNYAIAAIFDRTLRIPHITAIRIHTRMPAMVPNRIDDGLLSLLSVAAEAKNIIVVIHVNHANELSDDVFGAVQQLRACNALLLSQTVLLKNINDNTDALESLFLKLLDYGVLPYYLHQLDRVTGSAHFEVGQSEGRALVETLRNRLPGYALPRYVVEKAGAPSKVLVELIS